MESENRVDCVVSVVTYLNPPEMVVGAIRSCLNSSLRIKIYVVDNSPYPKLESSLSQFPIKYYFTGKNLGFGKAHNWALFQRDLSTYRLILNPDVSFSPKILEDLVAYMNDHQDVGAVMPKVFNLDGSPQHLCRRMPNPWLLFSRRFLPDIFRKKYGSIFDDVYDMDNVDFEKPVDIPYIPGCFLLARSHILEEIGGFDSRFFMYMEDVDLCRRIREKGFRTVYHPGVQILHGWQRGSYRNLRLLAVHTLSAIRYFNKWGWI